MNARTTRTVELKCEWCAVEVEVPEMAHDESGDAYVELPTCWVVRFHESDFDECRYFGFACSAACVNRAKAKLELEREFRNIIASECAGLYDRTATEMRAADSRGDAESFLHWARQRDGVAEEAKRRAYAAMVEKYGVNWENP